MVIRALKDHGVKHIFGYPGGAVLPIYDALFQDSGIEQRTTEPIANHVDELAAAFIAHVPDLAMIEVSHSFPVALVGEVPFVADQLRQQLVDSIAHPGAGVDAVGDVSDRNFGRREARPEVAEHLP